MGLVLEGQDLPGTRGRLGRPQMTGRPRRLTGHFTSPHRNDGPAMLSGGGRRPQGWAIVAAATTSMGHRRGCPARLSSINVPSLRLRPGTGGQVPGMPGAGTSTAGTGSGKSREPDRPERRCRTRRRYLHEMCARATDAVTGPPRSGPTPSGPRPPARRGIRSGHPNDVGPGPLRPGRAWPGRPERPGRFRRRARRPGRGRGDPAWPGCGRRRFWSSAWR